LRKKKISNVQYEKDEQVFGEVAEGKKLLVEKM